MQNEKIFIKNSYLLPLFLILFAYLSIGIFFITPDFVFGNDFYDFYNAGQAAFIEKISPYSEVVELRNQIGVYGKPAQPGQDRLAFNYPPYALIPFLPLSFLSLKLAQSIWVAFLFSNLLVLPLLAFPRIPHWAIVTAFTLYPISFSLILGNYAILMGSVLIFVMGYLLLQEKSDAGMDILAGALLAFCTIKPQFSAFFILFILLFALRNKRWRMIQSFIFSFLVFLALSFILLPSWPVEWYHQLIRYVDSNQAIPHVTIFLQLFMNETSANIHSIIITAVLFLALGWMLWKWWKKEFSQLKILVFIGFLTYFIHPRTVSYEQIVFLVPFLIWIFSNSATTADFTKIAFWFSAILISWAGFFASKAGLQALFPLEWIFLFYLLWMGYIFLSSNAVHLQTHDSTDPQTLVESN